jgi:hypothetical protein
MRTNRQSARALAAIAALAVTAPAAAHAKAFATDTFSIELGDTPVCFAVPVSLHDAAACRGLPPLGAGDIDTTQVGLIAAGGLRRGADEHAPTGNVPLVGLVQVFRVPASLVVQPAPAEAERVAVDATRAILANLPSEARRGRPVARLESVDGLVVVRTVVDVDGLAPNTRAGFFAHIETATIFGRDATYTVVWSGPEAATATLGRLAEGATRTMRLAAAQHPAAREAGDGSVPLLAKTLLPLALAALVGALYMRARRGKGNRLRAELWPAQND